MDSVKIAFSVITKMLSETEDSSSDDELIYHLICQSQNKRRVENFIENVVHNYSDDEFNANLRVSRRTANKLVEDFSDSPHFKQKIQSGGKPANSPELQMLSFLWFAGNKTTYREVANVFGISLSSVHRIIGNVSEFFFDISANHIKMPQTEQEKENVADGFWRLAAMKDVLGCIDGSYIYIRKPAKKIRSTYVNRHGLISITLQAICDADRVFLDVFVGSPSRIHDSRIFKLSPISKDIPSICGGRFHILGDAAYPLREYMITPYRDYGDLTDTQKRFNKAHCRTRVKIENAFGLLKNRFRQLSRLDFFNMQIMCKFVMACCVLHNICIKNDDMWPEEELSQEDAASGRGETSDDSVQDLGETVLLHRGKLKRNLMSSTF